MTKVLLTVEIEIWNLCQVLFKQTKFDFGEKKEKLILSTKGRKKCIICIMVHCNWDVFVLFNSILLFLWPCFNFVGTRLDQRNKHFKPLPRRNSSIEIDHCMSIATIQTHINFWPFQVLFVTSQSPSWQPPVENELLQLSLEQDSNHDLQTVALKYLFLHRNLSKFDQKVSQNIFF